jgi:ankyrin repeat protein
MKKKRYISELKVLFSAAFILFTAEHCMALSPLFEAVLRGDKSAVKSMVAKGAYIEETDRDGRTPLLAAIESGNLEMVEFLLKNGANTEARDTYGRTVAYYAVLSGKIDLVRDKRFAAHINALDRLNKSPLHIATEIWLPEISLYLLSQYDGDINAADVDGRTMLHYAVMSSDMTDVVEKIVEMGGDVNKTDVDGSAPLHLAASCGHAHMVNFLLENGAKTDGRDVYGQTVMHCAVLSQKIDLVRHPRFAAFINVLDNCDRRPLDVALYHWLPEISLYLLSQYDGDINAADGNGRTILHHAASSDMTDVVAKIVEMGGEVNKKDGDGNTPLHWVAKSGRTAMIDFLCGRCNADPNVKNNEGQTPLDIAASSFNRHAVVDTLKAHNAKRGSELP